MTTRYTLRPLSVKRTAVSRWRLLAMQFLYCFFLLLGPTTRRELSSSTTSSSTTTIDFPISFVTGFTSTSRVLAVRRKKKCRLEDPQPARTLNVVADPTKIGRSSALPPPPSAVTATTGGSQSSSTSSSSTVGKRKPPRTKTVSSSTTGSSSTPSSTPSSTSRTSFTSPPSSASTSPSFSTPAKGQTTGSVVVNGAVGNWESLHGNWVLRPSASIDDPPRAVVHFLGGALVGASPQISYRYMLEKLAEKGFLVVATPYNLSFDHLATCDEVLTRFEDLAPTLAREYGALPVVGIGHSCGALLQLLITCLFPDTPRAANALLSFNNKPVTEAVPFFEEFFAPVFTSIATPTQVGNPLTGNRIERPSSNESLVLGLKLAKAATQGVLPSDELLQEAATAFSKVVPFPLPPPPFFPSGGGVVGDMFGSFKNGGRNVNVDSTSSSGGTSGSGATTSEDQEEPVIKIPTELREAYARWAAPSVATLAETGVLPLIHETIISLEQIPKLVDEVAQGARDFNPTPSLVRSAAGKAYRARRTLIIGYEEDQIDESDEVEEVLKEARSITRMRRPMVEIDVQRKILGGGHAAPLIAPPLDVAGRAEDLLGLEIAQDRLGYSAAAATVDDLVRWLEEGNL